MNEHVQKVFIVGTPKSGTSFLYHLLNDHPNALCLFETEIYASEEGEELEIRMDVERVSEEEIRRTIQDIGSRYQGRSAQFATIQALIALVGNHNTTHFIEKTPRHFVYADAIFEDFPNAKIIHMLRDPRDNYLSLKKRMHDENSAIIEEDGYHPISFLDDRLLLSVALAYKNIHKHMGKYKILYYEDLIYGRAAKVKDVIDWIGLPWHSILHVPTLMGEYWGGNSSTISEMHPFDARAIGNWIYELSKREVSLLETIIKVHNMENKYRLITKPNKWRIIKDFAFPFKEEFDREPDALRYLFGDYFKKRWALAKFLWTHYGKLDYTMIDERFVL